jgi:FKBP-type peptidyl-prolyl cis-trans isomerase SlyD
MERIKKLCAVTIRLKITAQLPEIEARETVRQEFEFILGVEHQVPTLEKALEGMSAGHQFSLVIPPHELYGAHDAELIREIPKEGLLKQRVREGEYYRQMKMGSLVEFKVLEIKEDTVLVDFNKPLAGISALMEGEVLAARHPSEEEISKAEESQRKREIGCG